MKPARLHDLTSAEALERLRGARRSAEIAEVRALEYAVAFAHQNGPGLGQDAARLDELHDVPLAGEGAPTVHEAAIADLAVALHLSHHSARTYLGRALELAYRLPRLWLRVRQAQVPPWRATMVAAKTHALSPEAAAHVDAQVAPIAHKIGPSRLMQTVEEAITLHDHVRAGARAAAAAESRHVTAYTRQPIDGHVEVVARLDHADALDLDSALGHLAAELAETGDSDPLAARRAKALGLLARRHLTGQRGDHPAGRRIQLYVHLDTDTVAAGVARVEHGAGTMLVPLDQIKGWCTTAGTAVRITPVLDLTAESTRSGYQPAAQQIEQAMLRAVTCVHPYCSRAARRADIDHIHAWLAGGATASFNLAPLCRFHHRVKTHHRQWSYEQIRPGVYLWAAPTGRHYVKTRHGTDELPP